MLQVTDLGHYSLCVCVCLVVHSNSLTFHTFRLFSAMSILIISVFFSCILTIASWTRLFWCNNVVVFPLRPSKRKNRDSTLSLQRFSKVVSVRKSKRGAKHNKEMKSKKKHSKQMGIVQRKFILSLLMLERIFFMLLINRKFILFLATFVAMP